MPTVPERLEMPVTTREVILTAIDSGLPLKWAAKMAKISYETLNNWRKKDAEFDAECEFALARVAQRSIGVVLSADDWRAHSWYLSKRVDEFKDEKQTIVVAEPVELPAASEADVEAVLRGDK